MMLTYLIDFFTMYSSTIPYVVFFHMFYGKEDSMKESLLWMLPCTLLFYAVVMLSYLIPNELLGMAVKTVVNSLLYILFFHIRFRKPYLQLFFLTCQVSIIVIFSQLLLSVFLDLSYFTNYLSEERQFLYITIVSLLCSVLEVFLVWFFLTFFKKSFSKVRIPGSLLLLLVVTLTAIVSQGALLMYFNNSDSVVSPVIMIPLIILYVALLGAPIYMMFHETTLRQRIRKLPVFSVSNEHLNDQLHFLEQQKQEIQAAETELRNYKQNADLSVSINDVYAAANKYVENLYTDNPVINTLLMYYSDRFEHAGITYSFQFETSTYTPIPDNFLIYVFSGLLDNMHSSVSLRFTRNANIYTLSVSTTGGITDTAHLVLKSLQNLSSKDKVRFETYSADQADHIRIHFLT